MADSNDNSGGSGPTKTRVYRRVAAGDGAPAPTRPMGGGGKTPTKPMGGVEAASDPVKTTVVGDFGTSDAPFEAGDPMADPVVGWLVVTKGPGRGSVRGVGMGLNTIGRDPKRNIIHFDLGDGSISGEKHAVIVYDNSPGRRSFAVKHEEGRNLTKLGGNAVLELTPLHSGDEIEIGATTLRFVALCGPEFDWADTDDA